MLKIRCQKVIIWFVCLFMYISPSVSQEIIEVKGAIGESEIVGRISEVEARQLAINNAKVEALRKAGVGEYLKTYENLFRSETNNDFSEFFSSDIHAELQGAIKEYQIVDEKRKVDQITNLFMYEVTLNASVILYSSKPDPTFTVKVEGVKSVYEDGENFEFTIYSTKDCFLHIFGVADGYTAMLYPNSLESQKPIKADKTVSFPLGYMEYPLFKTGDKPEVTRVIIVFTKEPIRFLKYKPMLVDGFEDWVTTSEDIFSWIYSITPDARMVEYQVFTVR
ncbi:MAG TPA: DUF4384 domain-containing protein [Perlabentimonas sp.]|nr:DUF4384 domain-containing protein [Bacteroidales bacterium]MDD4673881.1 DUF4384 domain-containing protein [Bacteroidales bacterium]MDY0347510.1 DUF4384 domain-containing protein [Tenuifilaceae bacterium]HZJ74051.1 DUF4384 domain-containing protein [Perlabentimonas sp.]